MAKRKRCQQMVPLDNGKTKKCGFPLDIDGRCPEHGLQK